MCYYLPLSSHTRVHPIRVVLSSLLSTAPSVLPVRNVHTPPEGRRLQWCKNFFRVSSGSHLCPSTFMLWDSVTEGKLPCEKDVYGNYKILQLHRNCTDAQMCTCCIFDLQVLCSCYTFFMLILFLLLFVKRGTTKTEALVYYYYYCYLFSPPVLLLMDKKNRVAHPPEHILRAAFSVWNGLWGGCRSEENLEGPQTPPPCK